LLGGQYVPSSAEINLLPDGTAAATNGQHQVYFPADIYTGAIREITPEDKVLTSQPLGISYDDGNNTVLLAALTNSVGELVASNQVIYPNAFVGINADLRYTYTRAGFEQDVILHERPPNPQSLSLNPKTTKLQVLTEFFNAPAATVTAWQFTNQLGMTLTNEDLDFGVMKMPMGRAFLLGATARAPGASFTKEWLNVAGRRILVEEAPVLALTNELSQLFASAAQPLDRGKSGALLLACSVKQQLPGQQSAKTSTAKFMAVATPPNQGLVLDYQTINGSFTGYDFQGDTTYYVSGNVYLYGACTNEGGAVLKCAANTSVTLESRATLQWRTSAYHPVVFTAKDDNTVGEPIGTGNPSGYYANPALNFANGSGPTCSNFCVRYAEVGLVESTMTFRDAQFVNCQEGISSPLWSYSIWRLQNVLFENVDTCLFADSETLLTVNAENVTIDSSSVVIAGSEYNGWVQNAILTATNCIFANIGSVENDWVYSVSGSHNGFYNCGPYNSDQFGDNAIPAYGNPFQSAGGGNCYSAGSFYGPYSGTTAGLDPTLLADLKTKTTYPPDTSYVNQTISSDSTLQPRGLANTGTPALGYHYPILDYIFSQTVVGANLTLGPGTAVGWQGQGLSFSGAYTINFNGTVNQPCYFVRCNTVQEADNTGDGTGIIGSGNYPTLGATFTRFSAVGDLAVFFDANSIQLWSSTVGAMCNCEFWSGAIGGSVNGASFNMANALLDRSQVSLQTGSVAAGLQLQNCTFYGGSLIIDASTIYPVYYSYAIADCAFDNTDLSHVDSSYTSAGYWNYNAYLSGATTLPGDIYDVTVSSFNWQTGPLGNFYLPNGSPLVHASNQAGDPTADSIRVATGYNNSWTNLTSFTTDPIQKAPNTGLVDIGYHYATLVAIGGSQQICPYGTLDMNQLNPNPDVFGLPLTYTVISQPTGGGSLNNNPASDLIYSAGNICNGSDQFTYQITDGLLTSAQTTVIMHIVAPTPVAGPNGPQFVLTGVNTGADTPFTFKLHGSDSCNDALTFVAVTTPAHALSFSVAPDGTVTYVPDVGYDSSNDPQGDSFTYTVSNCANTSDPAQVDIFVVPAPTITQVYCRKYHLVVDWSVPSWFATDALIGDWSQFRIYRTPEFPGNQPYVVMSSSARSYVDTEVTQGQTYCYQVEFAYQDVNYPQDPDPSDPYYKSPLSSPPVCSSPSSSCAQEILITGHRYLADGIVTYDFTDGNLINSFVPDTASDGRGLAIYNGEIYYMDLSGANAIHVCPYGTEGSGGHDTRTIKNPRGDTVGIQDLAFHYDSTTGKTELYALTGYSSQSPKVYEVDPDSPNGTVTIIGSTSGISITGPSSACDGFAVLPDGNFLINDDDASPVYREYYSSGNNAGQQRLPADGGQVIDLSPYITPPPGLPPAATGVAVAPDGSLYFATGGTYFGNFYTTALIQTNLTTHAFGQQSIGSDSIENIDVVIP